MWQVFEEERPFLVAYRGPFDGFHASEVSVSKTCLVRFDNNQYSVAARAIGRPVDVRAYADRIAIRQDGEIVAEHPRSFGRGQIAYDPWHYVPILTRKPGALRNGAPFKDWKLPNALGRLRTRLAGHDDGDRQFVKVLAAVLEDGLEAVEAACAETLECGACGAIVRPARVPRDVVLNILARQRQPAPPAAIPTPEGLQLRHQPVADCQRYDSLREAGHPVWRAHKRATERHDVLAMSRVHARGAHDDGAEARGHARRLRRHPRHMYAGGLKRRHPVQQIIGTLLQVEIADKTARSIKYQMASARLPTAKELADFDFAASPVNEPLIQELAGGGFLEGKRNIVLVGGTGTGKTHLAVAIARSCIRKGARGRCHNVVDLVNHLEAEIRAGRQGRTADQLVRRDFVILDELGYLPFATVLPLGRRAAALPPHEPALRANLDRHHHQPRLRRMAVGLRRPQDDHRPARPSHPSLRDHRDRQRELALQEPLLIRRRPCLRPGCPGGPTGTPHAASLRVAQGATRSRAGPPY